MVSAVFPSPRSLMAEPSKPAPRGRVRARAPRREPVVLTAKRGERRRKKGAYTIINPLPTPSELLRPSELLKTGKGGR